MITKKIVELHEGTIQVASAAGSGTTFTLRIPLHTRAFRSDESAGSGCSDMEEPARLDAAMHDHASSPAPHAAVHVATPVQHDTHPVGPPAHGVASIGSHGLSSKPSPRLPRVPPPPPTGLAASGRSGSGRMLGSPLGLGAPRVGSLRSWRGDVPSDGAAPGDATASPPPPIRRALLVDDGEWHTHRGGGEGGGAVLVRVVG
jgi:hypothetical protein